MSHWAQHKVSNYGDKAYTLDIINIDKLPIDRCQGVGTLVLLNITMFSISIITQSPVECTVILANI